jgi:F-type H+-transporting ATPase subunit c
MYLPIAEIAAALPIAEAFNSKFAVAIAGAGAGIGIGLIGYGAAQATGRNPGAFKDIRQIAIIGMALAEAIAFYAIFLG